MVFFDRKKGMTHMKAKQTRSVKTLKGQLFGAVAMIVVASVALGTSTYAWFINNAVVEVENMQLTVNTSTSMLVAVGKADGMPSTGVPASWTGYKATVTNNDITGAAATNDPADWTNMFTYPLDPASTTDALLSGTVADLKFYRSNGHLDTATMLLDQFNTLKVGRGTDTTAPANNYPFVGEGYVKRIPLKFLSSTDVNVYLGKDGLTNSSSLVTAVTASGQSGGPTQAELDAQAAAIQKALRVAVVARATTNPAVAVESVVLQFDDGRAHITGAVVNTDYKGQTTGDIDETAGKYRGISTTTKDADGAVATTGQLTAKLPVAANNGYLAAVDASGTVTAPATDAEALFTLNAGVEREVDVFIWLEGTDQDAVSTLSAYQFNLALPFAGAPAVVTPAP